MTEPADHEPLRAQAAEYRQLAKRHTFLKIRTTGMAELTDVLIRIMTSLDEAVAERDALRKQIEEAGKPKFAPFAPARRAVGWGA